MKRARLICVLAVAGALACRSAQSQSVLSHDARLPNKFGMLSNVVELANGGVVFADTRSKLFFRGNLDSGKIDTLGTRVDSVAQGSPAGQYKFPGWVAHLAGDTIALVDFSALRTTLWSEAGRPLEVLPSHNAAGKTPILLYDTLGRGYKIDYQAVLGGGEPGRAIRPDSIPVLRVALRSGSIDTVAHLTSPEYGDAVFGEQVQQAAKVFAPNDFFGVLPDGSAWVARGREGRVDWRSPSGEWLQGPPHKFARIPVTEADKARVLAQVREQGKEFGMPQDLAIVYPFAETKAPFDFALGRPNGEVWLQQPRNDEKAALVYAIFDRKGHWQRDVSFPKDASLAGFGTKGAVYGSIRNADGSRSVARFTLK
jgi:hypothetical protein